VPSTPFGVPVVPPLISRTAGSPAAGGGPDALRSRLGTSAKRLPERLAQDLERLVGEADAERPGGASASAGITAFAAASSRGESRAAAVGDAAEIWAPLLAPATALDHLAPETLLILDEPGDLGEAGEFLWRQADERRADLLASDELPRDWPPTLLPPRDWKRRLLAARTLELTWRQVLRGPVRLARAAAPAGTRRAHRRGRRALARRGCGAARRRQVRDPAANRDRL